MADSKSFMIAAFEQAGLKPWRKYIDYIRRAVDEGASDLAPYVEAFDSLRGDARNETTPEDLCKESGIPPKVIFGTVAAQLWDLGYTQANLMLAVNHPAIVQRAIKQAKTAKGFKDRESLLKANGVIPIPKNQSVHFHKHIAAGPEPKALPAPTVLPAFEDDMDDLDDGLPMLPAGGQ